MMHMRTLFGCLLVMVAVAGAENFDGEKAAPLSRLQGEYGVWSAASGHAELHAGHGRSGKQCLRLLGGEDHSMELELKAPLAMDAELAFWAERWTRSEPFLSRWSSRARSAGSHSPRWSRSMAWRWRSRSRSW